MIIAEFCYMQGNNTPNYALKCIIQGKLFGNICKIEHIQIHANNMNAKINRLECWNYELP